MGRRGPLTHEARFMRLALALARRGRGRTSPNPMVGAVVVRGGRIIGRGWHHRAGEPHAEVLALKHAGRRARGATLYVTLEPCNHHGRTPPCCDAILAAGVGRVVAAMRDPNSLTNGRGFARLRQAGVRVDAGVLAAEAQALNEAFLKTMRTGLPLVIAKIAQSLDGKIATSSGASRWITSPAARRRAHQWRSRVDAIVVGITTVLKDDPRLTVRAVPTRAGRPLKVILDSRLRTPLSAACLSQAGPAPTLIATTVGSPERKAVFAERGIEVLTFPPSDGRVPLRPLLRALARRGIHSVLIEGGGEVLAGALAERVVDRVVWFIAPVLIGGRGAPSSVGGAGIARLRQAIRLTDVAIHRVGPDLCIEAQVEYPKGRSHVHRHRAGAGAGRARRAREGAGATLPLGA